MESEVHKQSVLWPYVSQIGLLLRSGAWGLERNPRARTAVDSGEMIQGDSREEIPVENACGGKLGSSGDWVQVLNHRGWSHHLASTSPHPTLAMDE